MIFSFKFLQNYDSKYENKRFKMYSNENYYYNIYEIKRKKNYLSNILIKNAYF